MKTMTDTRTAIHTTLATKLTLALLGVVLGVGFAQVNAAAVDAQSGIELNRCLRLIGGGVVHPASPALTVVSPGASAPQYRSPDEPILVKSGPWRLHRDGTPVAGPDGLCRVAWRTNPTKPQPELVWLPGARVEGEGARGPARITWSPVVHQGVPATHYEIIESGYRKQQPRELIESTILDGSVTSFEVDLDTEETAVVRAWWTDGVSASAFAISPTEQFVAWPTAPPVPTDLRFGALRVAWLQGEYHLTQAILGWDRAVDGAGRPADRYEVIASNNHDGTRQHTYSIREVFAGDRREGMVDLTTNFLGGPVVLRAVWNSGGPAGGPQFVDQRLPREAQDFSTTVTIDNLRLPRIRPREASIAFRSHECIRPTIALTRSLPSGDQRTTGEADWLDERNRDISAQPCRRYHRVDLTAADGLTPDTAYVFTITNLVPVSAHVYGQVAEVRVLYFRTPPLTMVGDVNAWDFDVDRNVMRVSGWAIDPTKTAAKRVLVHAFVDGRRVKGTFANQRQEGMLVGGRYTPHETPLDSYGLRHGFVLDIPIPRRGNHVVCLRLVNADAGAGEARFPLLGCRATDEAGGAAGTFESLRWVGNDLVAAGLAADLPKCCLTNVAKVAFFLDGKKVARAPSREVESSALTYTALTMRFRAKIPVTTGAKQVCAVVVGSSGFQHIGCRSIPRRS